jgi:hypothetical protein
MPGSHDDDQPETDYSTLSDPDETVDALTNKGTTGLTNKQRQILEQASRDLDDQRNPGKWRFRW